MKKNLNFISVFFLFGICLNAQDNIKNSVAENFLPKLNRIFELQLEAMKIHPMFGQVYPVAITEEGQLYIFEPDENNYRLIKQAQVTGTIAKGIRAAYPLAENDYKMTCVVTPDVFDSLEGYAIIFHEFVHCAVYNIEMKLKENLEIYKSAMEKKDWMWELSFPFPYTKKEFVEAYNLFLNALNKTNLETAIELHKKMKSILSKDEYSYLTWVEWKEGFARWIENKIRNKFGLKENHAGKDLPFDRVTFYEGGSGFIDLISKSSPAIILDFEKLYNVICK